MHSAFTDNQRAFLQDEDARMRVFRAKIRETKREQAEIEENLKKAGKIREKAAREAQVRQLRALYGATERRIAFFQGRLAALKRRIAAEA